MKTNKDGQELRKKAGTVRGGWKGREKERREGGKTYGSVNTLLQNVGDKPQCHFCRGEGSLGEGKRKMDRQSRMANKKTEKSRKQGDRDKEEDVE